MTGPTRLFNQEISSTAYIDNTKVSGVEILANKGIAGGYAPLNSSGYIDTSYISGIAGLSSHVLAGPTGLGPYHTVSSLTTGYILKASGANQAVFAPLISSDIPSGIDATYIADGSVSNTEFQYLDGVTSSIQTQFGTKASTGILISAGSGLTGGGALSANRTISAIYGTGTNTICQGDDSRLLNIRYNLASTSINHGIPEGILTAALTAQGTTSGTVYYMPFNITQPITVNAFAVQIGNSSATSGAKSMVSIYNATTGWQPTTLVPGASGEFTGLNSAGIKSVTLSSGVVLSAGPYLLRLHTDLVATQPIYNILRGYMSQGGMFDATTNWQFVFAWTRPGMPYGVPETNGSGWTSQSTSTGPFGYWIMMRWTP